MNPNRVDPIEQYRSYSKGTIAPFMRVGILVIVVKEGIALYAHHHESMNVSQRDAKVSVSLRLDP